jgi:sec-independent protein translocase protein TatA
MSLFQPMIAWQMPGMGEWVVILVIVLVLFGGSRIPDLAKSLGQGIREFKKAMKDEDSDKKSSGDSSASSGKH